MKTRRITRSMATGVVVGVLAMLSPPMVFSGQTSADLDVTVLSSDNRSIVFEYRPRFLDVRTVNEQGMRMQVYDFIGSSSSDSFDAVGSPDLKYRSVPLGFPARDGNAVQVLQSDYEEISGVTVAPVPTLRVRDDMVEVDKYRIASAKYATSSFIPAQSVELPSPGYSRTMCVGYVKLFPVQYNPSTRTVRKYSRMVVQVVYGSFSRSRAVNSDDKPFRGVLLNYDVARNWKSAGPESSNRAPVISSVLGTGE